MRPSAPHYLPWSAAFLLALAALLAEAVLLVELDLVTVAYERLGLHPRAALALLVGSLLGSAINLPVARLRGTEVLSGRIVSVYGVRYVIPVVEHWPGTILAINVGGAVIPTLLSAYLSAQVGEGLRLVAVTALGGRHAPRGSGAPVASIGGAGTFDGIFVTGVVAVLLA